ncbi:hypothetical protein [Bradyrhizobium sp.]|uniref:hypothetical protein n=1 Tax=Bradyrhizobium sp. TaxID=376 RepID=UPI001EB9D569|nr:hypothetical protein [Bradyrhizobium sp.]MBV9984975.1 hypothetical protein [Bradyrhizobium sp.]
MIKLAPGIMRLCGEHHATGNLEVELARFCLHFCACSDFGHDFSKKLNRPWRN